MKDQTCIYNLIFGYPDRPAPPPCFPFLQHLFSFGISLSFWDPYAADTKHSWTLWNSLHRQAFHVLPVKLKLLCEASGSWLLVSLLDTVTYSAINRKQCFIKYCLHLMSLVLFC